jgi:hypothetical protein
MQQKINDVLAQLKVTVTDMGALKKMLDQLNAEEITLLPETRKLKVHTHLRTNGRKPTIACPEIVLRGNWLEKAGFHCDDQWVRVITTNDMIIITPELKKKS